jgi:hypothetical protein
MKAIFLLLFSIPVLALAQKDTALQYRHLVPIQGANKEELFNRAVSWFDQKFLSSKLKIENANKETGEISGKGEMTYSITYGGDNFENKVTYHVLIKVANTGYYLQVSNFVHQYLNQESSGFGLLTTSINSPIKSATISKNALDNLWGQVKQEASIRIEPLMDKLKVAMRTKAANKSSAKSTLL